MALCMEPALFYLLTSLTYSQVFFNVLSHAGTPDPFLQIAMFPSLNTLQSTRSH